MSNTTPRPRTTLLSLIVLWLVLYASFTLATPPLLDDADSVHAEVAREMLVRQDPVTLYANGIRYLEKAPVLYWSMAASMRIFGVHAAAARLPLALFVLALLFAVESFTRRAFESARAGLYAALILASSFGIFIFTRILIPDAIVCLWLTLSIFCFWLTEREEIQYAEGRTLPCIGFAASCAMNILTKGLIGLVFPIGIVLVYLLITRGARGTARRLLQLHPLLGLFVFFAIAAPWHLAAGVANPAEGHPGNLMRVNGHWLVPDPTLGNVHGWWWFYFVNEHLLRYLNLRVPRDYDTVPLVLFWGLLLVWLMPWSAFLFKAIGDIPWRAAWASLRRKVAMDADQKTLLLIGIWAFLPMLFFSFSTRQEYYVLPAMPAFAVLIAQWLEGEALQTEHFHVPGVLVTAGQRISVVLLVIGSTAALAAGFFVLHAQMPGPNMDLAALLKQNPGDYALSMGHFLDLNAKAMGAFRRPLLWTAVTLFGGTLAAWWARREYRPHLSNVALAVMAAFFLMAAHMGLVIFSPVLSSRQLARSIESRIRPGNVVVLNDEYEGGSTLGFYLQTRVHILHGHSANLWYGSFFTDAPRIFEDDTSMAKLWQGKDRVFLWTEPEKAPKLPGNIYLISQSGGKEILSNQKDLY